MGEGDRLIEIAEKLGVHPTEVAMLRYGAPPDADPEAMVRKGHGLSDSEPLGQALCQKGVLTTEKAEWLDAGPFEVMRRTDYGLPLYDPSGRKIDGMPVSIGRGLCWPSGKPKEAPVSADTDTVAYHEAGHVFTCYHLRLRTIKVTIEPDGAAFGSVHYPEGHLRALRAAIDNQRRFEQLSQTERKQLEAHVMIGLSGSAAVHSCSAKRRSPPSCGLC